MTKERGIIICLLVALVVMLMMIASSDRQLNDIKNTQSQNSTQIKRNLDEIKKVKALYLKLEKIENRGK